MDQLSHKQPLPPLEHLPILSKNQATSHCSSTTGMKLLRSSAVYYTSKQKAQTQTTEYTGTTDLQDIGQSAHHRKLPLPLCSFPLLIMRGNALPLSTHNRATSTREPEAESEISLYTKSYSTVHSCALTYLNVILRHFDLSGVNIIHQLQERLSINIPDLDMVSLAFTHVTWTHQSQYRIREHEHHTYRSSKLSIKDLKKKNNC